MTIKRDEPALDAPERQMLDGWLDYHRATLLWKCEGLSDAQLKERSAPPSSLSLLGLVRHMTEVERSWFMGVLRGPKIERGIYWNDDDPDGDFDNLDDADVKTDLETFKATLEEVREIAAGYEDLDMLSTEKSRKGERFSLRWIYTHMIEEYARHNGHADLLRERIDGATGD